MFLWTEQLNKKTKNKTAKVGELMLFEISRDKITEHEKRNSDSESSLNKQKNKFNK